MNTDTIFKRYWSALCAITDEAHGLDDGSVRLALRMAIDDTAAMTQPDDAALVTARNEAAMLRQQLATERAEVRTLIEELDGVRKIDQRVVERNQAEIVRINEWLAEHAPAEYMQPTDTATAVIAALIQRDARIRGLLGEVSNLNERLALSQAEVDRMQLDMTLAISVINEETARAVTTNGNGAGPHDAAPSEWWAGLNEEDNDWRISLEAGRRSFRMLPKDVRLRLVQAFARSIGNGDMPSQAAFDALRPVYMPMASGLPSGFNCAWKDILNLTILQEA